MKRILSVLILAAFGWSCSDLSVDPKFAVSTALHPVFELTGPAAADEALSADTRVWFDTTAYAAELRGAGLAGAEPDSSYITRIALRSFDSNWPLSNLRSAAILVGADTIATADLPEVTGQEFLFAKQDIRPAGLDLAVAPGDSVSFRLVYWLRAASSESHSVTADITIATEARAKFQ